MTKLKKLNIIFIILFIISITIPIININFEQGKISVTENRYLASFPEIIDNESGKIRKEFFGEFNNWLNDNIGFREFFVKLNADINYKLFNESSNPLVHIGDDGWMFYTNDNNLEIATGEYPLSDELLENIKNEQVSIQKTLAKKGIEYVLILTPSKVSIYPEKIGGSNFKVKETPIDIVADYLEKNTTIKVINTKDILLEAKKSGKQVFFKTDTHWNEEGAYIAYKYIVEKLNEWGITDTKPVKITQIPSKFKGEFSSMLGDTSLLPEEEFLSTNIINPLSNKITSGMLFNKMQNAIYSSESTGDFLYENSKIKDNKALLYGDSFFFSWKFTELLSENFSTLAYLANGKISNEMIDAIKPKVVIMERTERYIDTLANQSKEEFKYEDSIRSSAKILNHNTPTTIETGKKYNVNIIVKNTSKEVWNEEDKIRLSIWQDGIDHGYRVTIPENVSIRPGEEYTFTLSNFIAPKKESTYLEYQMVQEGIKYFGEKKRVDINIK